MKLDFVKENVGKCFIFKHKDGKCNNVVNEFELVDITESKFIYKYKEGYCKSEKLFEYDLEHIKEKFEIYEIAN